MNSAEAVNGTEVMNSPAITGLRTRPEPGFLAEADVARLLRVRRAAAGDRAALARMFGRCTSRTRYERFHGCVNAIPDKYLTEALSGSPFHYALIACADGDLTDRTALADASARPTGPGSDPGDPPAGTCDLPASTGDPPAGTDGDPATDTAVVALASCRVIAEGVAELGILVEDRWQRQGTGGHLLRELVTHADRSGMRVLTAQILGEQAWIIAVLQRYGTCHRVRGSYGILEVTLRLGQASPPPASATAIPHEQP